jgi:hypothetical protein
MTTPEQIVQWLESEGYFSNARVSYVYNPLSKQLSFRIEQSSGASLAGETERLKIYFVEASEVKVKVGELKSSEGDLNLYQMNPFNDGPGLIFDIWGQDEIAFTFNALEVKVAKEIERVTKPMLSDSTISLKMRTTEKPDADYWVKKLQEKGYDATYIGYFGGEIPLNEITDYTGLSIRPRSETGDRLALGVKFSKAIHKDGELEIVLELQNSELRDFWRTLISSIIEKGAYQIRSGNVIFTSSEWKAFTEIGKLPAHCPQAP